MRVLAKFLLPFLFAGSVAAAEPAAWVKESNGHSLVLLHAIAQFAPEYISYLGVEGYDGQVTDLKPKLYQRQREAGEKAIKELKARLDKATDPAVRQDLQIMILSAQDNQRSNTLQHDLTVPYIAVSRQVFQGIRTLLDPRISKERQAFAVERLKRYAGLIPKTQPIAELARERTEERLGDKKLLRPFKGEVEQDLADAPNIVKGVRKLFEDSGLDGWQAAMTAIEKQMATYDDWVRATVLPQARTDHRLPEVLYADNLKQFGVDIAPDVMIQRALLGFIEVQNEMRSLAPLVAREQKLKVTDYRDVIRELKKKQVTGEAILPLFQKRMAALEDIIRRERVVTLPERKAVVRLASEAESAMSPAPNMQPPRLIGNQGEYGEFVLPLVVPGKSGGGLRMDDFTHEAGSWSLAAHEARPGHELQFSAMVEKGISTARAVFAFNSVNIEGWGLYAEAEMKPTCRSRASCAPCSSACSARRAPSSTRWSTWAA